jgi:mitochondrial fission protein ELM1
MESPTARSVPPLTWVLTGHKAGDNTQVQALAEALGWPYRTQRLFYRRYELLTNLLRGVTLAGVDRAASSPLQPPWPQLVITAGRRNEPVARWIRRQSGGATRLVHVGRPWAAPRHFDLIVVTPQYCVPPADNVMRVDLPLHGLTRAALDEGTAPWAERFAALPRPWWVALLGGDSGPFVFTADKAVRLAEWLNRSVSASGGSVLVTNSARTPAPAYRAFLQHLQVPASAWHWRAGATDNPYRGYLAVADRLVVTGESISMLAEATVARRPLYIFDLSDCPRGGPDSSAGCPPWWRLAHNFRYKPLTHRLAMRFGPARMKRDISRIQDVLIESGCAVWAGGDWDAPVRPVQTDVLPTVASRVRHLFDDGLSAAPGAQP